MATKKPKHTEDFNDYEDYEEDTDTDADIEYLRRTTDRRHKVDHEPEDLDFN